MVTRYPGSFSSESMTESAGGKLRVGPVGRPRRRAAPVSMAWPWTGWPGTWRGIVSARTPGGLGAGCCADSVPPRAARRSRSAAVRLAAPAPVSRRARRRVMTQAQRMLTSYSRIRGTSITIIETASGGVGPAEEEDDPHRERRNDHAALALVEGGRQEPPDLIGDDRRGEQQPEHEGELQSDEERVGGAGEHQPPVGNQGRDRPLEQADDVEVLHDPPADQRAEDDGQQAIEDAPAQLLEMVEERHFAAGGGLRHGGLRRG